MGPSGRRVRLRVYVSQVQNEILEKISSRLGLSKSDVLMLALMEYAKSLNLVVEKVHS